MGIGVEESLKWRLFQLVFQLLIIESIAIEDSSEHNMLDLLWFPTGGEKSEAYLVLTAIEIICGRNQLGKSGNGAAVWMRYTLRLLTWQQFERSTTLISVLECMRKNRIYLEFDTEPITLEL